MTAAENLIALYTISRREIVRILRIWTQTLIPPAITMGLYFVIFGSMIGSRIGEIRPGIGYIDFLVPGLIYSIWRLSARKDACPACHGVHLVPADSPAGAQLVAALPPELRAQASIASKPPSAASVGMGRALGKAFARLYKR